MGKCSFIEQSGEQTPRRICDAEWAGRVSRQLKVPSHAAIGTHCGVAHANRILRSPCFEGVSSFLFGALSLCSARVN
ncbi:hypothetical protein SRHO_G00068180 [Serrasalmus rhombeus]